MKLEKTLPAHWMGDFINEDCSYEEYMLKTKKEFDRTFPPVT